MDRALDDSIADRNRGNGSYQSRDRRPPRDGVRKPPTRRDEPRNLDSDWVHDRYDDNDSRATNSRGGRGGGYGNDRRRSPEVDFSEGGCKVRVDNLHYDLTEEDIRELFSRKGPVSSIQLLYDRQDRSRGTAYVVMPDPRDARESVREYDGANANGQPIRVTLLPTGPASKPRNPFDTAERPSRSLFDRIEKRSRSESPQSRGNRRSDVRRAAPENIDRYIPGERNNSRRRSPAPSRRGNDGRRGGRRPGERQRRSPGAGGESDGHKMSQGRPKKTQEELDAEMDDYWGTKDTNGAAVSGGGSAELTAPLDGDVDMIE